MSTRTLNASVRRQTDSRPNVIVYGIRYSIFYSSAFANIVYVAGLRLPGGRSVSTERIASAGTLRKDSALKIRATGLLSKFRPQLNIDTTISEDRRFSFEAGDDAIASLSASAIDTLPPAVRDRLLRKSASMSSLENTRAPAQEPALSPVAQSPTTLAPPQEFAGTPPDQNDATRAACLTRIPTPTYSSSLARPRRDREDSASSLLTAIKVSRPVSQRSGSSSGYSSPTASRNDLTQGVHASEANQGSGQKGNRLLNHTASLRGGLAAVAAQKAAHTNLNHIDEQPAAHGQRKENSSNNNRSSTSSRTHSESGSIRKENRQPMTESNRSSVQGNAAR